MENSDITKIKSVHMVGIGGVGMSALARLLLHRGVIVHGSDEHTSDITDALEKLGADITQGHSGENISSDTEALIYSPAVPENNSERVTAREAKMPEYSYPEILGLLSRHPFTIAVSGTHGKTTTTAMIAHILKRTRVNPTVIVGSLLSDSDSNFVAGSDEYFLVEACEYRRSFMHLAPNILVITNIDTDHLDYYKDLEDIQHAFNDLVRKVPEEGFIVCDIDDSRIHPALVGVAAGVVNYRSYLSHNLSLQVLGEHNRLNAAVAEAVCDILGIPEGEIHEKLNTFKGTWRRQEHKGFLMSGAVLYDDYAHHPTEIQATLRTFKEQFSNKKIVVIFQPHLYSRTKQLLNEFATSFSDADEVFVTPIYAAREENDKNISHTNLVEKMKKEGIKAKAFNSLEEASNTLEKIADKNTVVITMGAGDIYTICNKLTK